jgi:hypothetical protein
LAELKGRAARYSKAPLHDFEPVASNLKRNDKMDADNLATMQNNGYTILTDNKHVSVN